MRYPTFILGLVFLALVAVIGGRVAACYWVNTEFQSDMNAIAVQNRFRMGMDPPPTEKELLDSVTASAKVHGINLEPRQVTVECTLQSHVLTVSLAADYEARVNALVYTFHFHFRPSSYHSELVVVK